MWLRIVGIVLSAALGLLGYFGFKNVTERTKCPIAIGGVKLPNPRVAYDDLSALETAVGFSFGSLPDFGEDTAGYALIGGNVAEISFMNATGEVVAVYRASKLRTDFSGDYTAYPEETVTRTMPAVHLRGAEGKYYLGTWVGKNDVRYALSISIGAMEAVFTNTASRSIT
jgi:hypothetical protein